MPKTLEQLEERSFKRLTEERNRWNTQMVSQQKEIKDLKAELDDLIAKHLVAVEKLTFRITEITKEVDDSWNNVMELDGEIQERITEMEK